MFGRRRLWLFLVGGLFLGLSCGLAIFRRIGLGELALILAPLALVIVIEGGRYVVKRFVKGYRG